MATQNDPPKLPPGALDGCLFVLLIGVLGLVGLVLMAMHA